MEHQQHPEGPSNAAEQIEPGKIAWLEKECPLNRIVFRIARSILKFSGMPDRFLLEDRRHLEPVS
jgi:hypothetical protein